MNERAELIAYLERSSREDRERHASARAKHEAQQAAINLAMRIYVDAVLVSPWRALAEDLRR